MMTEYKPGHELEFYTSYAWKLKRQEVLALDHYECQLCRQRGKYTPAAMVHHVKHLKDRPDLALSIWDGKDRQLISLCNACHEEQHPDRLKRKKPEKQLTPERW